MFLVMSLFVFLQAQLVQVLEGFRDSCDVKLSINTYIISFNRK